MGTGEDMVPDPAEGIAWLAIRSCVSSLISSGGGNVLSGFFGDGTSFAFCPLDDCFLRVLGGVDTVLAGATGRCSDMLARSSLLSSFDRMVSFILPVMKLPCLLVRCAVGRPLCSSSCAHFCHVALSSRISPFICLGYGGAENGVSSGVGLGVALRIGKDAASKVSSFSSRGDSFSTLSVLSDAGIAGVASLSEALRLRSP
jgi:hypothetical protein